MLYWFSANDLLMVLSGAGAYVLFMALNWLLIRLGAPRYMRALSWWIAGIAGMLMWLMGDFSQPAFQILVGVSGAALLLGVFEGLQSRRYKPS
ncbi:MAG TPA: hypothetical protein VK661_06870 [Planctomycetota bacterium]|nr:hypothetical protein [Planctomycetota bacterium]